MFSFLDIQRKVYEYGEIISAPKNLLTIFPSSQLDAHPYISISNDQYYYIVEERGRLLECRETSDIDLLLYWIMSDIVFNLSCQYELTNRVEGIDSRRLIFKKEVELFQLLSNKWVSIIQKEI